MRTGTRRTRTAVSTLLAVALSVTFTACGGSSNGDVTLTVGSRSFPEQVLLGQIYAQALEGAGYKVKKELDLGYETSLAPETLKQGRISGYPEHVGTVLNSYFALEPEDFPPSGKAAYHDAKVNFEKKRLTAFPPAPFALAYAVGMLRKTAEERGLKTISDLKRQSEKMTLKGPLDCHLRLDCLGGLETYYGLVFESFSAVDPRFRYRVLENEQTDASILYTTDSRLAAEKNKFMILEDDKHLLPAGSTTFVTSPKVIEEAGPDYEKTIVSAQKGLTLPVMQELDAQVEIEKKAPAKVAAQYLQSIGYTG